jgi:hypothetical protein
MSNLLRPFNLENGLIGLNRDIFLKITQYLNSTSLRKYTGISEETFQWTSHIHYALYRLKCDQLPLQVLKSKQCKHQIFGRAIIFKSNSPEGIVLRERIFEDIFEMKYKYIIPDMMIIGIFGQRINDIVLELYINHYGIDTFRAYNLYTAQQLPSLYSNREGKVTHIVKDDVLTFILNMLPNQNCAYYYINDILSRNVINNIAHTPKRIGLAGVQFSITMISMKRLRFAPIRHCMDCVYFSSNGIEHISRKYDLNNSYWGSYIKCY